MLPALYFRAVAINKGKGKGSSRLMSDVYRENAMFLKQFPVKFTWSSGFALMDEAESGFRRNISGIYPLKEKKIKGCLLRGDC